MAKSIIGAAPGFPDPAMPPLTEDELRGLEACIKAARSLVATGRAAGMEPDRALEDAVSQATVACAKLRIPRSPHGGGE